MIRMIERKLQDVAKDFENNDDNWLNCTQKYLSDELSKTPEEIWQKLHQTLLDDDLKPFWAEVYIDGKDLDCIFEQLKPIVFLSVYYYGIDYIYRKQGMETYNYQYIHNIIGNDFRLQRKKKNSATDISSKEILPKKFSEELTASKDSIYDDTRKKVEKFFNTLMTTYDEGYVNPHLVKEQRNLQIRKNKRKEFNLFLGNIITFMKKIYTVDDARLYSSSNKDKVPQKDQWKHFNNVLSTLTLILFEIIPDLPTHKNTQFGRWTFERMIDIDEVLSWYEPYTKLGISNGNRGFDKLLMLYAEEDLFHLNRINNAFKQYWEYLKCYPNMDASVQKNVILAFSLLIYLPSQSLQPFFLPTIKTIADMFRDEKSVEQNNILKLLSPILLIRGVLLPFLISGMTKYMYCREDNEPLEDEKVVAGYKEISLALTGEKYLPLFERVTRIWENPGIVIKQKRNKNPSKTEAPQDFHILNKISENDIPFEKIIELMLNQAMGWRNKTLQDENRGKLSNILFENETMLLKHQKMDAFTFVNGCIYGFLEDTEIIPPSLNRPLSYQ